MQVSELYNENLELEVYYRGEIDTARLKVGDITLLFKNDSLVNLIHTK